jgi:hypothetical protein
MEDELTNTEIMLIEIKSELTAVRTDIAWLKRIFGSTIIVCGALFGADMSGVV